MKNAAGRWEPKVKLSEQALKTSTPGMLQVRRFHHGNRAVADMIFNELADEPTTAIIVDPLDATRRHATPRDVGCWRANCPVPTYLYLWFVTAR